MSNGIELLTRYAAKKNPAVDAFVADVDRIKKAIDNNRVSGRSPVRVDGKVYKFSLLGENLVIDGEETAINVLNKFQSAAHDESDTGFRALIEQTYGMPLGEEPVKRRGRKPKTAE